MIPGQTPTVVGFLSYPGSFRHTPRRRPRLSRRWVGRQRQDLGAQEHRVDV